MSEEEFDERLAALIRGSPHGLVAQGEHGELRTRHLPESRELGRWLGQLGGTWMDLGTGGGLPGLVLARERSEASWVLVEARQKKAWEVARFAEQLGIECDVETGRSEDLAWERGHRECFEGVVARAVAPLRVLVELARGFLVPGGRLVAVKGKGAWEEVQAASAALERTRMRVDRIESLGMDETMVVQAVAIGSAPDDVPRRAGVPRRRPW